VDYPATADSAGKYLARAFLLNAAGWPEQRSRRVLNWVCVGQRGGRAEIAILQERPAFYVNPPVFGRYARKIPRQWRISVAGALYQLQVRATGMTGRQIQSKYGEKPCIF
jgi:hypothetical protein